MGLSSTPAGGRAVIAHDSIFIPYSPRNRVHRGNDSCLIDHAVISVYQHRIAIVRTRAVDALRNWPFLEDVLPRSAKDGPRFVLRPSRATIPSGWTPRRS